MRPRPACTFVLVLATALCSACGHAPTATRTAAAPQVLLLGEVHDNATGHRLRVDALRARIAAGWRPAIAMEQFDRDRQPALDAALRDCADAACVVARAAPGNAGWTWAYYEPVIALALEHRLPVRAANLSRAQAGQVVRGGIDAALDATLLARYGIAAGLPADVLASQVAEVRQSHCGMLPEPMVAPMARAQIARDVVMAEAVRPYAPRGVVLVAGNGHVRRDFGVPYWLRSQGLAPWSVGYVEGAALPGTFDQEQRIPVATRTDPCAAFQAPAR